jgi:hypothetical protein
MIDPIDHTTGRACLWTDDRGNVVMVTADAWDANMELQQCFVKSLGPFDDLAPAIAEALRLLTAQGVLF